MQGIWPEIWTTLRTEFSDVPDASEATRMVLRLLMAALLSLGSLLVLPLLSAHVPYYAQRGQMAAYYGFFAGVGGLVALFSNVLIGRLLPANQAPPQLLWWALLCIGTAAACGLWRHMARLPLNKEQP